MLASGPVRVALVALGNSVFRGSKSGGYNRSSEFDFSTLDNEVAHLLEDNIFVKFWAL